MKRFLSILLTFFLIFSFFGCKSNTIEEPVSFYYLRKNITFNAEDSVIGYEIADGSQFTHVSKMLAAYLKGPKDQNLTSPFPAGTYLLNTEKIDDLLIVTLSDNFAALTGISLSIACCALTKTIVEYTGVEAVEIQTVFGLLDGEKSVIIYADDIVLYDSYETTSTEPIQ